jgi:hypothetical protein
MRCLSIMTALGAMFLAGQAWGDEPIKLSVLYAGNPGTDRAKDFQSFLEAHVTGVKVTNFGKFEEAEAKDFDVVLFDWTSIYLRDKKGKIDGNTEGARSPRLPKISRDFAKPSILIGAAGGLLGRSLHLKIGWL